MGRRIRAHFTRSAVPVYDGASLSFSSQKTHQSAPQQDFFALSSGWSLFGACIRVVITRDNLTTNLIPGLASSCLGYTKQAYATTPPLFVLTDKIPPLPPLPSPPHSAPPSRPLPPAPPPPPPPPPQIRSGPTVKLVLETSKEAEKKNARDAARLKKIQDAKV